MIVKTATLCSYVLPLRWETDGGRLSEITDYLDELSGWCQVIVAVGSPDDAYAAHAAGWVGSVRPTTVWLSRRG